MCSSEILTAPVCIKVPVEVDPDALAAVAEGTVLPPHPVLRQTNQGKIINAVCFLSYCLSTSRYTNMYSYCCPCDLVTIRIHNRQDVDVHVVQNVSNV